LKHNIISNQPELFIMKNKTCDSFKEISFDHLSKPSRSLTVNNVILEILHFFYLLRNWLAHKVI